MSNSISITGRLGFDAELKQVGEFNVLEMSVANEQGFGDKKSVIWFRCSMWGARGEKLVSHLKKGQQVFISGELTLNEWTNKDGLLKTTPEISVSKIDFIGSKQEQEQEQDDQPF